MTDKFWDDLDAAARREIRARLKRLGWTLEKGENFQWIAVRKKNGKKPEAQEVAMNPYRLLKLIESREK